MEINRAVRKFGKVVQSIRKERGLTLEELSADIGLDQAHLSRIERGQKNITLATVVKVAEALGLDLKLGSHKLSR